MMLEKLGAPMPHAAADGIAASKSLLQRVEQAVDDNVILPIDENVILPVDENVILPVPLDPKDVIAAMVEKWVVNDFIALMLMGDEEKLGTQPDTD